jgi:hypothetical protein
MPGETAFATRYAITAAAVSRVICEAAGRIRAGTSDQETGNEGQIAQISSPLRDLDLDRPRRQFISSFSRMVGLLPKIGKARPD